MRSTQGGAWRRLTVAIAIALMSLACPATQLTRGPIATADPASPSPIPLPPNPQGYARIETKSQSMGCSITIELVACQRFSGEWRSADGQVHHTVSVSADGEFHWVDADLGELAGRVQLDDRSYNAQGWTIVAGPAETEFTDDRTGHGITVTDLLVTPF